MSVRPPMGKLLEEMRAYYSGSTPDGFGREAPALGGGKRQPLEDFKNALAEEMKSHFLGSIGSIAADVLSEVARADALYGRFPTIQHAAAVLRREEQEAWAEVWGKPVNRAGLRMELLHVAASALRFIRLLDEDKTMPSSR